MYAADIQRAWRRNEQAGGENIVWRQASGRLNAVLEDANNLVGRRWEAHDRVTIESLNILDEVVWFGGPKDVQPTIRRVAQHARDIFHADLSYPIIMTKSGDVLDGAHRIAKAYLSGQQMISAIVLDGWPQPDGALNDAPPG